MAGENKDDLLRRVTGQRLPQVPPPAKKLEGITGNPPLPFGKLVRVRTAESLSANERAVLTSIGWDDSMPIPSDMAERVARIRDAQVAEVADAIAPTAVTVGAPTPAEAQRDRLRLELVAAAAQEKAKQAEIETASYLENAHPSIQEAYQMASEPDVLIDAPKPTPQAPAATVAPQTQLPPPQTSGAPAAAPVTAPTIPITDDVNAKAVLQNCPHCNFDLRLPAVPEPSYGQKMAYLHTLLGQQCFTDSMELFNGAVVVMFRALTARELEVVYKQAYRDRQLGRAASTIDFWERINRYRLFAQLHKLHTTTVPNGFVHELPNGLSPETNAGGTTFWSTQYPEVDLAETIFPKIEEFVTSKVLITEGLFRVINSACNQFNRLVAKLEANYENSDFWQPTEEQS